MSHHHSHYSHSANHRLSWVVILSGCYLVAEIVGGYYSGSLALLADAGHMAMDTVAGVLSLLAMRFAAKPPTERNTFGFQRMEILAALANGSLLFGVALWIFYEAYTRVSDPQIPRAELMTVVALGGLVVNLIGMTLLHGHGKENLNVRGVWLHLVADTLGSVSAVIAGILVWQWGFWWADPAISVFIGILILWSASKLVLECAHVLLEGVPGHLNLDEIREEMKKVDQVFDVYDLHVWSVASGVYSLSAHVAVKEMVGQTEILKNLSALLRKKFDIKHVTLQIEPEGFEHEDVHAHDHCSIGHSH